MSYALNAFIISDIYNSVNMLKYENTTTAASIFFSIFGCVLPWSYNVFG